MNPEFISPFFGKNEVLSTEPLVGGRNNQVVRVRTSRGTYVVKKFINPKTQGERFEREVAFLKHCNQLGISEIPKLLNHDVESFSLLQRHIEGNRPTILTDFHFQSVAKFIRDLNVSSDKVRASLPTAVDALEQGSGILDNLIQRHNDIGDENISFIVKSDTYRAYKALYLEVIGSSSTVISSINDLLFTIKENSDAKFISPSDFGFHNCIESVGGLVFIDFEYSGIDSPLKLLLDFIYQPDFHISKEYAQFIFANIGEPFGLNYVDIPREVRLMFTLKWFLMILKRVFDIQPNRVEPIHAENYFSTRIKPLL